VATTKQSAASRLIRGAADDKNLDDLPNVVGCAPSAEVRPTLPSNDSVPYAQRLIQKLHEDNQLSGTDLMRSILVILAIQTPLTEEHF
jgi:hypothetical protein